MRHVQVTVVGTPVCVQLADLPAEVVALVAATPLSERTLLLILFLVAHEAQLAACRSGRLEVDFSRGKMHPYLRTTFARVDFEESD